MTVNIEGSVSSIPKSLDSLRTTPLVMHRITFRLTDIQQWYAVMREARATFGNDWRSQGRVRRKLERVKFSHTAVPVWFDVPDQSFATWCAVKLAVEVVHSTNK